MGPKEEDIETSLKQYRSQLDQIEEALKHSTSEDLLQLKTDLQELINLTEGSLLSLKKSNLLSLVGTLENSSQHPNEEDTDIEASSSKEENGHNEIIGMKCRAPFCHEWGEMSYHNAIIFDIESSMDGAEMVRVMFCNPTHTSMLFCKHFAEGFCRFEDSTCRFSHGHLISISELKPFEEPFFENILVGENCLAKDSGELWHKATIVDILEDKVQVMFDSDSHLAIKELQDIHPSGGNCDGDDNMTDDDDVILIETEEKHATVITEFSLKTTDALGQWEMHTKGIGSKLMLKMGYVIGEGLGKNSDGRAVPIPIEVLPQGKSLDKVMELRNRKQNAFKPNFKQKAKVVSNASTPKSPSIFDLINHKFSAAKNKTKNCQKSKAVHHISTEDLSKKSDRHINIQLLKTAEELKRSDHELHKLKDTLARSIQRGDQVTAKKINEKIKSMQEYQNQLRMSEKFMKSQKNSRKAHKDLISF